MLAKIGGDCHRIGVRKDIRLAIGKKIGDTVHVTLERATTERILEIPKELEALFFQNKKAHAFFGTLSFTNRKEYVVWITSAKRPETQSSRLQLVLKKLREGKRNPSAK